jgi:hypothetical protein
MSNKLVGIFAIAFILVSSSLCAQISVGAKAGANFYDTYQVGRKYFVSQPNIGFHIGAFGNYEISEKLHGRVEALFSTRGMYLTESVNGEKIKYERESSYIDFPVTASYSIWNSLRVHAGVVPSLFLQEYRSITRDDDGFKVDEGDQFRSYERWQFGAVAGASYDFALFGKMFEAGARYSIGLTRTNELIRDVRASRDPKYMMFQAYIACKIFEF